MGVHEVTNAQFAAFLNAEGNQEEGGTEWYEIGSSYAKIKETSDGVFEVEEGFERHPVVEVSWYGARAYAAWLSEQTGQSYRLPTEAEWEYAARGGEAGAKDEFLYSGSNTIDEVAWYSGNSGSRRHEVGQKQPNQLGLYDMSGNVWEWVQDWYGDYPSEAQVNPEGPNSGSYRVQRGGCWFNYPGNCRAADRGYNGPTSRGNNLGFRLARSF
jgi:formylglycine-generating enzyme required for sulfatase activity